MINNITTSKRGQTHLEAILATVIFIGFVFVLLYIIKPFETKGGSDNSESLIITIPKYLEANMTELGIKVTNNANKCFSIPLSTGKVKTYRVTSDKEELVDSKGTGTNLLIDGPSGFYHVYQWEEFDDNSTINSCASTSNYQLASSRKIDALSYKKMLSFNETYNTNYQESKISVGAPDNSDYGIIIIDDSGKEIIRALKVPKSQINVNVKEVQKIMVYTNGSMQNVRLRVYSY
ncbi:MAG: hypothetical protein AABW73_02355 [Nanoarchaeota archaeon]